MAPATAQLNPTETLLLTSLTLLSLTLLGSLLSPFSSTSLHRDAPLLASLSLSLLAFTSTYAMIRWAGPVFMSAGLKGRDLSKVSKKEIPEGMGAVCAVVYILAVICFIPFFFYRDIVVASSGGGNRDVVFGEEGEGMEGRNLVEKGRVLMRFPHSKLASYLSSLLTLQTTVILGLADDIFSLRWRHKFFIPGIASIPLLIIYHIDFGVTSIVVPQFLTPYFGHLLNLGGLYYIYMFALSIFAPNSINILAGINGLEVGQSIVIALLMLGNDAIYLLPAFTTSSSTASSSTTTPPASQPPHLLSLYLLLPFLGVSLPLWASNRYPSRVFVGDTYCYFAGILFASISILGHFSKTLLLLLIPQTLNFLYSLPQLFRLIPCPRHRLPSFNSRTGLLEPSFAEYAHPPHPLIARTLKLLQRVHLIRLRKNKGGEITESSNLTILNLWLVWWGPKREDRLVWDILGLQVLCGLAGLWVRHWLGGWVFGGDNRGALGVGVV